MDPQIRPLSENDLLPLYRLLSDAEVMRFLEPVYTLEKTACFLKRAGLCDKPLIYAVEANGDFIGYVIYHDYDEDRKELGWVLDRKVWGKGYAQILTQKLLAHAAKEQKSAILECAPEQGVTRHFAEKFGFVYMGRENGCDLYERPLTAEEKPAKIC